MVKTDRLHGQKIKSKILNCQNLASENAVETPILSDTEKNYTESYEISGKTFLVFRSEIRGIDNLKTKVEAEKICASQNARLEEIKIRFQRKPR